VERLKLPLNQGQELALRLGAERLQAAVSDLPLRYAPFFGRLAGLWGMPPEQVRQELTRARDSRGWSVTPIPGLRTFDVQGGEPSARAKLLRFEPRSQFPSHRHVGEERLLVLEGAFVDDQGSEAHAGDERTLAPGSAHTLHIIGGVRCVTAVSERGLEFTGPLLRWLNRFVR
jgi:quercetin dioxygenase-like cupin family protein